MVTDEQVRRLRKLIKKEKMLAVAAARAGMDEKTARKWRESEKLPSEFRGLRDWRTRTDGFVGVWPEVRALLEINSGLQAKTIFGYLQRRSPGVFADGQLRTLQRRIRVWRATEGPPREVFFAQVHEPGRLCQSDFTHMKKLDVTIAGEPFDHLLYHFVLTYSNWETGTICFSESFEALSEGLQNALWELSGVPVAHQTDQLSTAVNNLGDRREFTKRYSALLGHYGLEPRRIQVDSPNENGDIEQSHNRLKTAIDQSLMLRGSRDFASAGEYEAFLREVFAGLNAGRRLRFDQEQQVLKSLPKRRVETMVRRRVRVGIGSTVNVMKNTYSVNSRLIGEIVDVHIFVDHLKLHFGQRLVEVLPRLRGSGKSRIDYRHIIDWLVRKPGAFANYRFRADLFPSVYFRLAYDMLKPSDKEYLKILKLAADEGEQRVQAVLKSLIDQEVEISAAMVEDRLRGQSTPAVAEIDILPVDLPSYDRLLEGALV